MPKLPDFQAINRCHSKVWRRDSSQAAIFPTMLDAAQNDAKKIVAMYTSAEALVPPSSQAFRCYAGAYNVRSLVT
jgi:hypothetical protein